MTKKLKKMTLKEHIELGKELKILRKQQFHIANKIIGSYGKTSRAGRITRVWSSGGNMLDKIICEMDNIVVRETERQEWDMNGYGWIYMGGDVSDFLECQECGKVFDKERMSQSVIDGSAICPMCQKECTTV